MSSELLTASKIQKEFINIAAHELQNPIQPILGLYDILMGRKDRPKIKRTTRNY
jgi:two-component system, OmpR family, sensor histidine kinase VicK